MYEASDPRSRLAGNASSARSTPADDGIAAAQYSNFSAEPPDHVSAAGSPSWYYRGQNFMVAFTRLKSGDQLRRDGHPHEYVVLLTDGDTSVRIETGTCAEKLDERAVVVVPPGNSVITAETDCDVVRLFDGRSADMMALASNSDAYAEPHPRVAPLVPWPAPVGGDRLRVYRTDAIPKEPGRFGRIFRTSAFMVNVLDLQEGPRDTEKLSPHDHEDFEQCSLAVEGSYVHHIRTPWTSRQSQWREDEHRTVGSPSVAIIPPPTLHTSAATGEGRNQLVDIFCPPRVDFSAQPGWVLNADDYPAPEPAPR